jgi:D-alanyl-D-alanine dipeptidase
VRARFAMAGTLALASILLLVHPGWTENTMPENFVDLKKAIPSVALEIRYYGDHNFLGTRVDGYQTPKCLVTAPAAEALAKVQAELQEFSLSLKIYDCYRPQQAVDHFVRWAKDIGDTKTREEFYPTLDKRHLFRDGYIAEKSSHSRGSTIDLTIVPFPVPSQESYIPGQPLRACYLPAAERFGDNSIDMGTGFDCFHELSHPGNLKMGLQQRIHRLLLKTLMDKYGFRNYDQEWWHFTLRNEPHPDTYFDFPVK